MQHSTTPSTIKPRTDTDKLIRLLISNDSIREKVQRTFSAADKEYWLEVANLLPSSDLYRDEAALLIIAERETGISAREIAKLARQKAGRGDVFTPEGLGVMAAKHEDGKVLRYRNAEDEFDLANSKIVGDVQVESLALAASAEDKARLGQHFEEHVAGAAAVRDEVVKLAQQRAQKIETIIANSTTTPQLAKWIRGQLRSEFGDLFIEGGTVSNLQVDFSKAVVAIKLCFSGKECNKGVKYALCASLLGEGADRRSIGQCRSQGPGQFVKIMADGRIKTEVATTDMNTLIDNIRGYAGTFAKDQADSAKLRELGKIFNPGNVVTKSEQWVLDVQQVTGIRGVKETSYWPGDHYRGFVEKHWGSTGQLTGSPEIVRKFDPKPLASTPGGMTQQLQVKYGDHIVNVWICVKAPCGSKYGSAVEGDILSIHPECGPSVVTLLPPTKMTSSLDNLRDASSSVQMRPCK